METSVTESKSDSSPLIDAFRKNFKEISIIKSRVKRLKADEAEALTRIETQKVHRDTLQHEVDLLKSKCETLRDLIAKNQQRLKDLEAQEEAFLQESIITPSEKSIELLGSLHGSFRELLNCGEKLRAMFTNASSDTQDKGSLALMPHPKGTKHRLLKPISETQKLLQEKIDEHRTLLKFVAHGGPLPNTYIKSSLIDARKAVVENLRTERDSLLAELKVHSLIEVPATAEEPTTAAATGTDELEPMKSPGANANGEGHGTSDEHSQSPAVHEWQYDPIGPSAPNAVAVPMETISSNAATSAIDLIDDEFMDASTINMEESQKFD